MKQGMIILLAVLLLLTSGCAFLQPPVTEPGEETIVFVPTIPDTTTEPVELNSDWRLILVNQWNKLPDDYSINLTQLRNGNAIDERAYPDLQDMMDAARAEGFSPLICSSYRTQEEQEELYIEKVNQYLAEGYSQESAETEAGKWVAFPGTSEHQTGLAVDIVALSYQVLDEHQEETAEQKWLMENAYKYGFILRYPPEKSHITGVNYEPWHYRYVGKEAAREIHEQGLCLEEYLDQVIIIPPETEPIPTESIETEPDVTVLFPKSIPQTGDPITPQPGDTTETWDAEIASAYPDDSACTDIQLLEKWLTVEGLTFEDLDERNCDQLILVSAQDDGVRTTTVCYERQASGEWVSVEHLGRMNGFTGSNGIAHNRRRNTNTSPAGLWALGTAFGNAEKPHGIRMPWRDVTPNSDWVCDANSVYFNTWQERDDPNLISGWDYGDVEHLEDYVTQYAYAVVIQYNTPPYTIPDRGCAIFLHCSRGATGGCIGLNETDMLDTMLWLDPECAPHILITGYQKR